MSNEIPPVTVRGPLAIAADHLRELGTPAHVALAQHFDRIAAVLDLWVLHGVEITEDQAHSLLPPLASVAIALEQAEAAVARLSREVAEVRKRLDEDAER